MAVALANAYASLDDLREYLAVDDTAENNQLNAALNAASRLIDRVCERNFINATSAEPTVRTYAVRSDAGDLLEVVDVIHDDQLTVALDLAGDGTYSTAWTLGTHYEIDNHDGDLIHGLEQFPITALYALTGNWPASGRRRVVKVTGRHGWPAATPDPVRQAALIFAARLYRRPGSPEGVITTFGESAIRVGTKLDPDAMAIISPYRRSVMHV